MLPGRYRRFLLSAKDTSRTNQEDRPHEEADVVDFSGRGGKGSVDDRDTAASPILLLKPEMFGKTSSPVPEEAEYSEVLPNRSVEIIHGRCTGD